MYLQSKEEFDLFQKLTTPELVKEETSMHILLLEDNADDAELVIHFLKEKKLNCKIDHVSNKEEFIRSIDNQLPDIIISDYGIPGFGGIEAFRLIKEKEIDVPFILITGSVSEKFLVTYLKEGIDDYILKNNLLRLPSCINQVLNLKKLEQEKQNIRILHEQLQMMNVKLMNAYKDISDSINYSKRIQQAIISDFAEFQQHFPDSFLMLEPKDILSGDFFWFSKHSQKVIFAVADCTGHGIPGAMLSILGTCVLNDYVAKFPDLQPAQLLQILNLELKKTLSRGKLSVEDGMDIALCVYHPASHLLEYAGARRPLYIIRNKQLHCIKADRTSIGVKSNESVIFTNNRLLLESGDRILLSSDGYADQFGGSHQKRISKSHLEKLLLLSTDNSIVEQGDFLHKFFIEWKGKNEQTDDAILFGMSIK